MKASFALLLSGLVAQHAEATWDRRAGRFNSPQYNNNECTDKQKDGFNWQDLPRGSFSGYDEFNFKGGWTCADSFGKRDSMTKRSFSPKCVKNKVAREKPASFDCTSKKDGFSVKEIQVSVEFDCDLEFHYKMPDNSICKQIAPCKKEGTVVQNTQCGGAREVDVYLGSHNQLDREDCEIGFHHIDFDCNPGFTPPSGPQPPESSTIPPPDSSRSPSVESSTLPPQGTPTPPVEVPSLPPSYPTLPPFQNNTAPPVEIPSSSPPASLESSTTPEAETSTTVVDSLSISAPATTGTPVESPSSVPPPPEPSTPAGPPGGYTPPECLPKCMNTWLEINTACKDNTDADCYCKNPDFTKSVIDCVAAWATDAETQEALQYLIGICATDIPENPGIITDCPSYIPINPTSPPATGIVTTAAPGTTSPLAIPVTTITYDTTIRAPCSCAESTEVESTVTSTITVPQVIFTTETPAQPPAPGVTPSEAPVALVPGTPPSVPAETTTPPFPIPSNTVPTSLGTVLIPSGSATFTQPAQFTGAAAVVRIGPVSALFGAALAFLAL